MRTAMGWRTGSRDRAAVPALAAALLLAAIAHSGPAAGVAAAQDRAFEPVTDAMLADPDPADWLHWRRTLDGWGYSPLDPITYAVDGRQYLAIPVGGGRVPGAPNAMYVFALPERRQP